MRILLYTGKGGVGKTSVAAATALRSAQCGRKTLVVSTDPAHSLGDSLDVKLSNEPMLICDNLWAQEIDTIHEVEKSWGKVQKYLTSLLTAKAVKDITTEELTVFPGMEDLLSLLRILQYYKEKTFDVIIIDCAPTGETLALLSFPELLRWWMEKLFPVKRKAVKLVKPIVEPLIGVPMPSDGVMSELENIYNQLDEMRQILSDREITSIRVVVNLEKMVIKEAQRSFTYLNIYDYNVDAIVINKVFPQQITDDYFRGWKAVQAKYKEMVLESFSPVPVYEAPLFEREVVGLEMLSRMAEATFGDGDPTNIQYSARTQQVVKEDNEYILSIYMPFAEKKELALNQKGEELIIRAGSVKRSITLPRTLLNLGIQAAKFEADTLKIRFGGGEHE
ncbi:TRC40/GET3/ArsA family transport-energizing ATPase [Paenibacillus timonensis]|uniref:ArsA family ATPase n=1 Tax=Paenibacillus timonensis TaxID=225915 RepID=A0ABW3SJM9_9BACL|nr:MULTISPECIES: TRC40/GET3/ArsA family transport-energizing ATPase [Paenibacillus]MCH1642466.1 TRC40/GET3/ArsA family transport-energizing ATPase [Paenibacillus timonensis]MDU2241252.1 TRC40/GET3/ArsA family transport-energizing ATPase [Paenibacillus sp.]